MEQSQFNYYQLVLQAAYSLSANWHNYCPIHMENLPALPFSQWTVIKDSQYFPEQITIAKLQTVNPYIPDSHLYIALQALVEQELIESTEQNEVYCCSEKVVSYFHDIEIALSNAADALIDQVNNVKDRLAVLTVGLIDKLRGQNAIPMPIFDLALNAITPHENALPQIQQRLFALLAFYDDAHIAAWITQGYTPESIRLATQLLGSSEALSVEKILEWPVFYDETYVQNGLDELVRRGDVLYTGSGYALTGKGIMRRDRTEALTQEYFAALFETRLSDAARREWVSLMNALVKRATVNFPDE